MEAFLIVNIYFLFVKVMLPSVCSEFAQRHFIEDHVYDFLM